MNTKAIVWGWFCAVLIVAGMGPSARGEIDVLIIGNDPNISTLSDGLYSFGDFDSISTINWSNTPDPIVFSGFEAVVVTVRTTPLPNATAWGNLIADYAHNGGGVVTAFAFYTTFGPTTDYGRLQLPAYNPFTRGSRITEPGMYSNAPSNPDPLMAGVNELMTEYRYDILPTPQSVLVARFDDNYPLAGYLNVGSGRVVGIQAHYVLNPFFQNNGDYMQLYRNAVLRSVPEPSSFIALLASLFAVLARRRSMIKRYIGPVVSG